MPPRRLFCCVFPEQCVDPPVESWFVLIDRVLWSLCFTRFVTLPLSTRVSLMIFVRGEEHRRQYFFLKDFCFLERCVFFLPRLLFVNHFPSGQQSVEKGPPDSPRRLLSRRLFRFESLKDRASLSPTAGRFI